MARHSRKERLPKMVRKRFIALLSRHGESNDALGTRGYETITMQNDSLCGPIYLGSYLTSESKKPRQMAVVYTTAICLFFFDSDVRKK